MSGIFFGLFKCKGKRHTVNKESEKKYVLKFEDDEKNKLTVLVDETTFEAFRIDDPLPWKLVKHQTKRDPGRQQ